MTKYKYDPITQIIKSNLVLHSIHITQDLFPLNLGNVDVTLGVNQLSMLGKV